VTQVPLHRELARLERQIFRLNQQRVAQSVRNYNQDFLRYRARYRRHTRVYDSPVTPDDLHAALVEADVIYLGDYHTLKQSQKTCVRLLRRLAVYRPDLCVGLEVVQGRHQRWLDRHVAGKVDEEEFLRRIGFRRHWVFGSFAPFRAILQLVRAHGLSALALDLMDRPDVTFADRDAFAAERVAIALAAGRPVLAFVGELHVAPPHLPAAVRRVLRKLDPERARTLREVVVYQNPEGIYWELSRRGLEHQVDVVRVKPGVFAINAVPPVLCQQSFLVCLEQDDQAMEDESVGAEQFRQAALLVARLLGVDVSGALDEVEVHGVGDLRFLDRLARQGFLKPGEMRALRSQVARGESFFLPRAGLAYLAGPSMNHAAEEATHFVRHVCVGDREPRGDVDRFYALCLNEMMGFFGSKLVNHRRKSPDARVMRQVVTAALPQEAAQARIATLSLRHRADERGGRGLGILEALAAPGELKHAVAHVLGYWLGDQLYHAVVQGRVNGERVRDLFQSPLDGPGEATRAYFDWSRALRDVKPPARL
jgi:hypothetical protein